jgi:hypothetical protein
MKNSAQKIRTSHVGRLPVPQGFEQTALRLTRGEVGDEEVAAQVVPVVTDVVKPQVGICLDFCKRHGFPPWQPSARQQGTASTQPGQTVSARFEGAHFRRPCEVARFPPMAGSVGRTTWALAACGGSR